MSMEIKLTDIRGEPPLQVGEFILDKDNNVMYVGSGDFELSKCRGVVDLNALIKVEKIPPNRAVVEIPSLRSYNLNVSARFSRFKNIVINADVSNNINYNLSVVPNFSHFKYVSIQADISNGINYNLDVRSDKNVT